jgi:hypothetical protein
LGLVRHLIEECGADANVKDAVSKFSQCHFFTCANWIAILTSELNVSVLQHGCTPLHLASIHGHLDVVQYLMEKCGANWNAQNDVREFDRAFSSLRMCIPTPIVILASVLKIESVAEESHVSPLRSMEGIFGRSAIFD